MEKLLENTRRPDVSFARSGTIRITARVARMLSLRHGDFLNIARQGSEFLLYASRFEPCIGRHEAQCHPSKNGSYNFCAHSARLCQALLDAVGITDHKASFMVGEPIQAKDNKIYIPIITRQIL